MQATVIDVWLEPGKPMFVVPYSDVHWDSRDCDRAGWLADYKRNAARGEQVRFLSLGDFNNLVTHGDLKRYLPSCSQPGLAARDDYYNAVLDDTVATLDTVPGARWDLWCLGNHENEALKRHHFDLTSEICKRKNIRYGTYSGRLLYRIFRSKSSGDHVCLHILYHHGAWGGQVVKGFAGAKRFADRMGTWRLFLYGHNHQEVVHREPYWDYCPKSKKDMTFSRYYINTGTWLKSMGRDGQAPDYSEERGLPAISTGTPVIRAWYERSRTGNHLMNLHCTVEL